jgi:hypothetical protein
MNSILQSIGAEGNVQTCEVAVDPVHNSGSSKVVFTYQNIFDVAVGLLKNETVFDNPNNVVWEPEVEFNKQGKRVFTSDLSSGMWWRRTHKKLQKMKQDGETRCVA